jgi:hypothetical protein
MGTYYIQHRPPRFSRAVVALCCFVAFIIVMMATVAQMFKPF